MKRRLFLGGLLAAPAIVRASSLMPIIVPKPALQWPPVGFVAAFSRDGLLHPCIRVPDGWLPCNGAALSRAAYPQLYAVLGAMYGGAPGTFNLPDLRGKFGRGIE